MALKVNTSRTSPNTSARTGKVRRIVIHHWNDPKTPGSLAGTVSWLCNRAARVSAHYVVSGSSIYRLVPENRRAWHAAGGNDDSIGIECDPRQQDSTYASVAALIRDIRSRHGDLPLVRHRDVQGSSTACPGTYDLGRLDRLARSGGAGSSAPATVKPTAAPPFPLPRRPGRMYYYGPADGPQTSVSGRGLNTAVPADVQLVHGRWRSHGLARWQQRMAERGYSITVDGRYGDETERIVRYFQALVGLPVDGKIGPATYAAAWTEAVR